MDKLTAHSENTPLHRAFSFFLFNSKKELLIQQRSHKKKTWPLVWTNSVCGHPKLYERPIAAARRRLQFELGVINASISMALPDYRYRAEKDGIVENEICPVLVGFSEDVVHPNPDEVEAVKWIAWEKWVEEITKHPKEYSPWCVEETQLLVKNKKV